MNKNSGMFEIMTLEFNLLSKMGNIGFYESCEVTEIFLENKQEKEYFNFFTLVVFEEKPFERRNRHYINENRVKINSDYNLGIQRSWFLIDEMKDIFQNIKINNVLCFDDEDITIIPDLKYIPKQFIPSDEGSVLNKVLKNNFYSGSYILEFFDEEKENFEFLLHENKRNELNELIEKIKSYLPIELSVVRDRIGNIIFQFPVNILKIDFKGSYEKNIIECNFEWNKRLKNFPNCFLYMESLLDSNTMGNTIEEYNQKNKQIINLENLQPNVEIRMLRKEPDLLLHKTTSNFVGDISFSIGIVNHEPRIFEDKNQIVEVQICSNENPSEKNKKAYDEHITNRIYDAEKKDLENSLSFKQYNNNSNAIEDLKTLIKKNDTNGVYLWDPYISPNEIIETLYYSESEGIPLKVIGSLNHKIKSFFNQKNPSSFRFENPSYYYPMRRFSNRKTFRANVNNRYLNKNNNSPKKIISEYKKIFNNPKNNNHGLNLEFRVQYDNYGSSFHDRFLIFPGSIDRLKSPKVYSLGTSINSFGKEHNILQEISHSQPVIDAFNELWEKLDHKECLVWKYP